MSTMNETQEQALGIIPIVTGSLSIIGSSCIIYMVATRKKKKQTTYHRLLLAMSFLDILFSSQALFRTSILPSVNAYALFEAHASGAHEGHTNTSGVGAHDLHGMNSTATTGEDFDHHGEEEDHGEGWEDGLFDDHGEEGEVHTSTDTGTVDEDGVHHDEDIFDEDEGTTTEDHNTTVTSEHHNEILADLDHDDETADTNHTDEAEHLDAGEEAHHDEGEEGGEHTGEEEHIGEDGDEEHHDERRGEDHEAQTLQQLLDAEENVQGCDAVGFLTHMGVGVAGYNAALSLYYFLVICRNMKPEYIAKAVEPFLHGSILLYVFGTATASIFLELFNVDECGLMCYIAPYPFNCVDNDDVECIRGGLAEQYIWWFSFGELICFFTVVIVCQFAIYWTVRKQVRTLRRYSIDSSSEEEGQSKCSRITKYFKKDNRRPNSVVSEQEKKITEVAIQATLYVLVFFVTWFFVVFTRVAHLVESEAIINAYLPLAFIAEILFPLQGFLNFLVYLRPIYKRYRSVYQEASWWAVLRASLLTTDMQDWRKTRNNASSALARKNASSVSSALLTTNANSSELSSKIVGAGQSGVYDSRRPSATPS